LDEETEKTISSTLDLPAAQAPEAELKAFDAAAPKAH